jgi:hypothetical protein
MRRTALGALLCLSVVAAPALAGSSLSIRLVRASNSAQGNGAGLEDVISVLKKSLVYSSYTLAGSASTALPARNSSRRLGPYTVTCNGPQGALAISVRHGRRELLKTSVSLRDGKPLILGGFPDAGGKLVLVFIAG